MARYRTFLQDYFHSPIDYETKTKVCVSICKSICVYTHLQTQKPTASKLDTEIPERVFQKTSKGFFKNRSRFLKLSKKIFSWLLGQTILLFQTSLCGT